MEYQKGGKTKNKNKSRNKTRNKTRRGGGKGLAASSLSRAKSLLPSKVNSSIKNHSEYTPHGRGSIINLTNKQKNEIRLHMKEDRKAREEFSASKNYNSKVRSLVASVANKNKSKDDKKYSRLKRYFITMGSDERHMNQEDMAFIQMYEKKYPDEIIRSNSRPI